MVCLDCSNCFYTILRLSSHPLIIIFLLSGKDAGKIAGELKEVPKEFQKGLEEGESSAKAMKAKIAETEEESKE